MLEALLLTAVSTGNPLPLAESRVPTKPSLELLEFLGEFGDDEDGVFEGESDQAGAPAPAPVKDARVAPASPPKPKAPVTPPPRAKESP